MKREKKLTKKERKAQSGVVAPAQKQHIHCVACGRHINAPDFAQGAANWVRCAHGTKYAACNRCVPRAMQLLRDHDQTGKPVQVAAVWH